LAHSRLVLRAQGKRFTCVGVFPVAFCRSIGYDRLARFVEEVLDAVLDGGGFGRDAWFAGALGCEALAVFGGCGFDAALFFAEASALELAADFGWQVLGLVDGAAVVVAEATCGF
jgi:hypothetical protein